MVSKGFNFDDDQMSNLHAMPIDGDWSLNNADTEIANWTGLDPQW